MIQQSEVTELHTVAPVQTDRPFFCAIVITHRSVQRESVLFERTVELTEQEVLALFHHINRKTSTPTP